MRSKKKKIEPELLQTPWQKPAVASILKGMQQPFKPFQPSGEGFTPYKYTPYPAQETKVGRILESPYYQALKKGALTEETAGIGRLRRGAQLGGMLYSTPRLGEEAKMIGGTTTKLQQILGGMAEAERTREKERAYREFEKGGQIGYGEHLRGEAERVGLGEREYQEHLRGQEYPQQTAKLAQILLGYSPWYQPTYEEKKSGLGGALGGILGALATAGKGGISSLLGAILGQEAGRAIFP